MQFTLSGTARINPRAADDVIDTVLGTTPPGATVSSTEHLIGDPLSRASAAVDGNPNTAWNTPLVGVVGQQWRAHVDQGINLRSLDLEVAVDQQHSLPTKLGITVDGVTREFAVPPLPIDAGPGAVTRVTYTPDQPLVGRDLTLEILEIAPRAAPDVAGTEYVLPVGIAEVGLGAAPLARPPGEVVTTCRNDLLTIDDAPVGVRVTGDVGANVDGRLAIAACDGAPLTLTAGNHVLRTAPGLTTGIDLDQLALVSPQFTAAPPAPDDAPPNVASATQHRAVVSSVFDPFWLRLNQSFNRGWEATAHTAGSDTELGPAHSIGGFANGWFVDGPGGVPRGATPHRSAGR